MPRKIDPVVGVLEFFETAGLEVIAIALSLCKAAVKRRTPAVQVIKRTRRKPQAVAARDGCRRLGDATAHLPTAIPPPAPAVTPLGQKKPRTRAEQPGTQRGEEDLALPGIGPATIGDE